LFVLCKKLHYFEITVTAYQITRYNNQKDRNLKLQGYENIEACIFRQWPPKTMKIQNYSKHSKWVTSCIRDNLKKVRTAVIVKKFLDLYMCSLPCSQ